MGAPARDVDEALDLAPGELALGRYRLQRRLGRGGFGEVWRARDERLGRCVALKVIPGAASRGARGARGAREAAAAARLSHPAIVGLFEAVDAGDSAFLVSELVEGRTLAELGRAGALSDRDVSRIGLALCDGLRHAHAHGVVHRDVKPQNVLVPKDADAAAAAKLTDFGVAHLVGDDPLTRTGDVLGTLAYMAPEQASGQRVDGRADLYALGLVLHEALAGAHPARHGSPAAALRRLGSALPSLRRSRRDLPRGLVEAIDRATAPAPEARGTLEALAEALAEYSERLSDAGGIIAPGRLERLPARRLAGGLPRLWTVVSGVVLAGVWLAWVRPAPPLGIPLAAALVVVAGALALLPRITWTAAVLAMGAWTALGPPDMPGAVVVAALALTPALALLSRRPAALSLPAAAAGLAALGLGGAAPALGAWAAGGTMGAWHERARAGALAWWGVALAELETGRHLGSGPPGAALAPGRWVGSVAGAVTHALAPLASSGILAGGLVWALAAVALPWAMRARSLPGLLAGTGAWALATAGGSAALAGALGQDAPRGAVAGAATGALIAAMARLLGAGAEDAPVPGPVASAVSLPGATRARPRALE